MTKSKKKTSFQKHLDKSVYADTIFLQFYNEILDI